MNQRPAAGGRATAAVLTASSAVRRTRLFGQALVVLPLVVALVVIAACDQVKGSGNVQSEHRALPAYSMIAVNGDVEVDVTVGTASFLSVTTDDNLLPLVKTEVNGDRLEIGISRVYYRAKQRPVVTITVPNLTAVEARSAARVTLRGADARTLALRAGGSARLTVAGRAENVTVKTSGAATIDLAELMARSAGVYSGGSSSVLVQATEELSGSVSGRATLRYRGAARVSVDTSGSARLTPF